MKVKVKSVFNAAKSKNKFHWQTLCLALGLLCSSAVMAAPAYPANEGEAYFAYDGVHLRFDNPKVIVNGKKAWVHKEAAHAFCNDIFYANAQDISTKNRHDERFAKFNSFEWSTFSANKEKAVSHIDCGPLPEIID